MRFEHRMIARALGVEEIDLAKHLAKGLPGSERLTASIPSWRGDRSCNCGCASYYVFPDGAVCSEQGVLANEAEATDEHGHHYMLLLFTCARGLHEVEIAPLDKAEHGFLPTVAEIDWTDK